MGCEMLKKPLERMDLFRSKFGSEFFLVISNQQNQWIGHKFCYFDTFVFDSFH